MKEFYDPTCSGGVTNIGDPDHKFNFLRMGSETSHQLGWYLVTLATEYELLRINGETAEMQKTLEEIFLALQAYKRLDMLANCMAKERYDEITDDFEVDDCNQYRCALCPKRYRTGKHTTAASRCDKNCNYTPDLSGTTGFYLREDATQELENMLNDDSEDQWNIDLVSSDYALAQKPPCTSAFSQACFQYHRQNFGSIDQIIEIMKGLAFIKKYIPEEATVTTCDGSTYYPLDIAQDIAKGFIDAGDNPQRRLIWPGSQICCDVAIQLRGAEGGDMTFVYAGLEYMYNYINDDDEDDLIVNQRDRDLWGYLNSPYVINRNSNGLFFLETITAGLDVASYGSGSAKERILAAYNAQHVEIYNMMNNLLFPAEPNLAIDKNFFADMLCSAPCLGACVKPGPYDSYQISSNFPEVDCPNVPDWTGRRWETKWKEEHEHHGGYEAELFNGLDFMALHNIYMLQFPDQMQVFHNPETPGAPGNGAGNIEGPEYLCIGETKHYKLVPGYTNATLSDIAWSSTSNITLFSPTEQETNIKLDSKATPSFIEVNFKENRAIPQYYYGVTEFYAEGSTHLWGDPVQEKCILFNKKEIYPPEIPDFTINSHDFTFCSSEALIEAIGPDLPNAIYSWKFHNAYTPSLSFSGSNGKSIVVYPPTFSGTSVGKIILTVTVGCVSRDFEKYISPTACNGFTGTGGVYPNPAQDEITIAFLDPHFNIPEGGLPIRIISTNSGTILTTGRIYSALSSFNTSALANGNYTLQILSTDENNISIAFTILRN